MMLYDGLSAEELQYELLNALEWIERATPRWETLVRVNAPRVVLRHERHNWDEMMGAVLDILNLCEFTFSEHTKGVLQRGAVRFATLPTMEQL